MTDGLTACGRSAEASTLPGRYGHPWSLMGSVRHQLASSVKVEITDHEAPASRLG